MSPAATASDRLTELDATRGLAVMGILLINIIGFSMPFDGYVNPAAWGGTDPADLAVWAVNQLLFEGRMRGLFALLFGVSALLVIERGDATGGNGTAIHLRRMAALAVLGLAHFVLVWEGDILLHYALIGLLIPLLRPMPVEKLLALAAATLLVTTFWWSVQIGLALHAEHAATAPGATAQTINDAGTMLRRFPVPGSSNAAIEVARMRGDYAGILAHRAARAPTAPYDMLFVMGPETLSFMLIGMALWKGGFFTGGWDDRRIRQLMIGCYAASLPVMALLTGWAFVSGFDPVVMMGNFLAWVVPFRVLCAVGHLALMTLLIRRFVASRAVARLAAVGRMALSNYLATSIVMTTIFYGYGFGLFGQVDRAPLYGFVLAMWVAMLAWSHPWLDRFAYGPFEWLWRSLARMRLQPMRRT